MWKLYLFNAYHTDAFFKLPLEKSIKFVQVLKETIDLNWSKTECQKMPIVLQAWDQIKHKLSPLDFQSTACDKSQYFISGNKSMENHVQHFACVLRLLWVPQGVIHWDGSVFFQF